MAASLGGYDGIYAGEAGGQVTEVARRTRAAGSTMRAMRTLQKASSR